MNEKQTPLIRHETSADTRAVFELTRAAFTDHPPAPLRLRSFVDAGG